MSGHQYQDRKSQDSVHVYPSPKIKLKLERTFMSNKNYKHTVSIAKAIQVPHRPQQIQIFNHFKQRAITHEKVSQP